MPAKTRAKQSAKRTTSKAKSKGKGGGGQSGKQQARSRKTPRTRKPEDMSLEQWQIALRREFGQEQDYKLENLDEQSIFSRFRVTNPESGGTYEITIRGAEPGDNHCTCPDFAINTLGTCKHIEFALAKLAKKKGGKRALAEGFVPEASEIYLRYDAKRDVVFRPGQGCPDKVRKLARKYFDDLGRLKPHAYERFPRFLEQVNNNGHVVTCRDDVLDFAARVRDQKALRQRLTQAYPEGAEDPALDKVLNASLYPYQREGALFAASAGRALIADDMGLGKTVQAIAAAEMLAHHGGVERVLIVCPTSLKHQWKHEIEKFTRREADAVRVIEGAIPKREALYREDALYKIVNYEVIHRDMDAIADWSPDLVILDEAQRIKNWQTRAAKSVKQLDSPHAIVLTGTPLENRLQELYSIVEFVDRFRLGPMFRFLHEHQHVDDNGRVVGYRNLDRIKRTLKPILIRRTRKQVLEDLPERLDKKLFVPMTPQQQRHHDENKENVARIAAKWRKYHFLSDADQRRLMIALQNMRMACDSTYLLDQTTDHGVKADELSDLLTDILEDSQSKVVIFSQWLRMHELLADRIQHKGWGHALFHGGVPGAKRKELVRKFKQDPDCRCFLSTDAGGVGLNLQTANVVVNVDQPWNPAVLEQRIGRVHRLGQHRPVRVIHLVAQGAIEEGMLGLIDFKKSMFSGALDGGQSEVFLGGSKLKRFMETVETATGHISPPMAPESNTHGEPARQGAPTTSSDGSSASRSDTDQRTREAWNEVAATGLTLLEKLGQAMDASEPSANGNGDASSGNSNALHKFIRYDETTGESELRVPLPDRATLDRLADALHSLANRP